MRSSGFRNDVVCPDPEDPIMTLNVDGTSVDFSIIDPMLSERSNIAAALLVPFTIVMGVIFLLAMLRLSSQSLFASLRDLRRPTSSTRVTRLCQRANSLLRLQAHATLRRSGQPIWVPVEGGSSDEDVRSRCGSTCDCRGADASIYFEVNLVCTARIFNHLSDFANFGSMVAMYFWPPNPGFTVITNTRSTRSSTCSTAAAGVAGLSATAAVAPRSLM